MRDPFWLGKTEAAFKNTHERRGTDPGVEVVMKLFRTWIPSLHEITIEELLADPSLSSVTPRSQT